MNEAAYEQLNCTKYPMVTDLRDIRHELQHNHERGVTHIPLDAVLRLVMALEKELENLTSSHSDDE